MKLFLKIIWIVTVLLSIATGVFKLSKQQADIDLFAAIGFEAKHVFMLGILQVLGGVLLIPERTRRFGAYIMIATFIIASIAVFANQMWVFAAVSVVFITLPVLVLVKENKRD
jgi:hypothetical protein